ncbi:hypothetical protein JTE90_021226 [Oedothorax gibbosus]|uniref:C2H2-type domain-containing protein n=1 Tax=Oedothorax gibbosus TaxID=931172 RepID=A0AAV6UUP6_9ARAC|nr:hypothetical protein JTE90_021226 [Oedothorax gibbosus]
MSHNHCLNYESLICLRSWVSAQHAVVGHLRPRRGARVRELPPQIPAQGAGHHTHGDAGEYYIPWRKGISTLELLQPTQCPWEGCTRQLVTKISLYFHLKTHRGDAEEQHKCTHCSKVFGQQKQLDAHLKTHEAEKAKDNSGVSDGDLIQLICAGCGKGFDDEDMFAGHECKRPEPSPSSTEKPTVAETPPEAPPTDEIVTEPATEEPMDTEEQAPTHDAEVEETAGDQAAEETNSAENKDFLDEGGLLSISSNQESNDATASNHAPFDDMVLALGKDPEVPEFSLEGDKQEAELGVADTKEGEGLVTEGEEHPMLSDLAEKADLEAGLGELSELGVAEEEKKEELMDQEVDLESYEGATLLKVPTADGKVLLIPYRGSEDGTVQLQLPPGLQLDERSLQLALEGAEQGFLQVEEEDALA